MGAPVELTTLANNMTLTLRFSDANKIEVHNYEDSLSLDKRVDKLLKEAAEKVLRWSDPYILAVYYYHQGRFDEAKQIASEDLPPDQVQANMAYLQQMLAQQNTWAKLKEG